MINQKLKLCIVSSKIFSLFDNDCQIPFGGAEVQLYLLSKEFSRVKKLDVNLITGDMRITKKPVKFKNIKIHISQPLDNKISNFIRRPLYLFRTLKRINPDIIIQRTASIETSICALYSKLFKKKFIYSIAHDNEVKKKGLKFFLRFIFKYGLKQTDLIIAQSRAQIKSLQSLKIIGFKSIKILKSGYQIEDLRTIKKDFILWVGRSVKWKRGDIFLKIAKEFPNENFIMICRKSRDIKDIHKIYEESIKLENLQLIDFVPFHKIDRYFKDAKILINTSSYEGFPNTFIQALKNCTPIVSLNVDPDNILMKNKCGFYCNDDYQKLKYYIKILVENKNLYQEYAKNSYKYAKKNHDIKLISQKWIKIINTQLGINNN